MATATKEPKAKAGRPAAPPVEPIIGLAGEKGAKVQGDTAKRILTTLAEALAVDNKVTKDGDGTVRILAKHGCVVVTFTTKEKSKDKRGGYFEIAADWVPGARYNRFVYDASAAALGVDALLTGLVKKVQEVGAWPKDKGQA